MRDMRWGTRGYYRLDARITLQILRGFNGFCAVAKKTLEGTKEQATRVRSAHFAPDARDESAKVVRAVRLARDGHTLQASDAIRERRMRAEHVGNKLSTGQRRDDA